MKIPQPNRRQFLKSTSAFLATSTLISCNRQYKKPNILFAMSDDQSWPHASAYGCKFVNTPAFDYVAKTGILFNNAFCAAPQCSPNRASILTGRNIWQNEEAGTHASLFPKHLTVFTDELEKAGYKIGYTGKPWHPGEYEKAGWTRNPAGPEYNDIVYDPPPNIHLKEINYTANFNAFLSERDNHQPFFFWFGASEPHRGYKKGSGLEKGMKLEDVSVPSFLPDVPEIQSDLLDYAAEIEWFDDHLGRMITLLEERGELENTLIVVTSDNGMPFPRAKANLYEYSLHMPLAVSWPKMVTPGRTVDDIISSIDFAPTFLNIAQATVPEEMTGKSFADILLSRRSGAVDPFRTAVFAGRERHSHSRPDNLGYPSRAIRTHEYLYIWNVKPDRWPAGDPTGSGKKGGYHDVDRGPTKTYMLGNRKKHPKLYALSFEKRPEEELYNIQTDPDCIHNLAMQEAYQQIRDDLSQQLKQTLKEQQDPRAFGSEIFDSYPRYFRMKNFKGFKKEGAYNPAYQ